MKKDLEKLAADPRGKFEEMGDAAVLDGKISVACVSYIFGHDNSKFKFIFEAVNDIEYDLVFDTVLADNIELFEFLVRDRFKRVSKRTIDYIFDNCSVEFLDRAMADDVWEHAMHDAALVSRVSIIEHFKRARTGLVPLNSAFKEWGPFDTRILYVLMVSPPKYSKEIMQEGNLTYTNEKTLVELMLFAPLRVRNHRLSKFEVSYVAKRASPRLLAEMLDWHSYVRLTTHDIYDILRTTTDGLDKLEIRHMIKRILGHAEDPILQLIYETRGFACLEAYVKQS